jgi:exosome complex component RRP42
MVNIISEITKDKVYDFITHGSRCDGRSFSEFRDIRIETGHISKANGSALVTIGGTTVIAGVKLQVAAPFNNSPDQGILVTNTELLAIASRNFEYGPPNKFAIEISRVVDRTIRESPIIDLNKLCIVEGKKSWKLYIDIYIVDFDGNIMDTACLGAVCALLDTTMPTASVINNEVAIDEDNLINLPINKKSVLCSVVKVNDQLIVDPIFAEEQLMDASLSIGFREDGSICAMQKCGLNTFTRDEVLKAVQIAKNKSKDLFDIINNIK